MPRKKNGHSKLQQKTYYELLALMLLKKQFPSIYTELEYMGGNHTPDLEASDHSIGVEVTCAFKPEHMERQAFFDEYAGRKYSDIPTKVHERLYKCGKSFGNDNGTASMLIDNGYYDSFLHPEEQESLAKECIKKKYVKLNSGKTYSTNRSQELFVFLKENLSFKAINEISNFTWQLQSDNTRFDKIYISSNDYATFYRLYELNGREICVFDTMDIIASCRKLAVERLNTND